MQPAVTKFRVRLAACEVDDSATKRPRRRLVDGVQVSKLHEGIGMARVGHRTTRSVRGVMFGKSTRSCRLFAHAETAEARDSTQDTQPRAALGTDDSVVPDV